MITLHWTTGAGGWLDAEPDEAVSRRRALADLFTDHALDPMQHYESPSDDCELIEEIVATDGARLVACAQIVVDPSREPVPARIFGQAALPGYVDAFLTETMENMLVVAAALDPYYTHVEGFGGRTILNPSLGEPAPYSEMTALVS